MPRFFVLLAILLSTFPVNVSNPARAEGHMGTAEAVRLMQAGGLNLYIRHAITDRGQIDTGRRGDRAGQRNIDARGEAQARALGDALRRLGIPVSDVRTSEVFRAKETAELAFGADHVRILDVAIADDYTPRDPMADALAMRRVLGAPPASGNAVFVGHIIPFGMITGRSFSQAAFPEGAVGLVRPLGERIELIGVVSAEAVIRAADLATPWAR
jgi:phosphohistidine phosphatase SixA